MSTRAPGLGAATCQTDPFWEAQPPLDTDSPPWRCRDLTQHKPDPRAPWGGGPRDMGIAWGLRDPPRWDTPGQGSPGMWGPSGWGSPYHNHEMEPSNTNQKHTVPPPRNTQGNHHETPSRKRVERGGFYK